MRKIFLFFLITTLLILAGCKDNKKDLYMPEAKNDKIYTTVGGGENTLFRGDGYTLSVSDKDYRYEKDYDDGNLEETWEYIKKDDIKIKVTTYKNTDEITARGKFLKENDDYIFEDLTGYSLCGREPDGDTLWFRLHEAGGNVYIISWEYPKSASANLKTELSDIADTFKIEQEIRKDV